MNEAQVRELSDEQLDSSLGNLFLTERKTTRLILIHLLVNEERQIYAKRGYDSLRRMLVEHYKLSDTSARRRIRAMQLMKDVPSTKYGIVSGELNLTTLSMAQSQIKQEEKITGQKITPELKLQIVESIKNKTQYQAEIELFKLLPETASRPRNTEKRVSEDMTRLGLNFPDHVLNKLRRLKEIWSHVDPGMDIIEVINRCADETLKRVDPSQKKVKRRQVEVSQQIVIPKQNAVERLAAGTVTHQVKNSRSNERSTTGTGTETPKYTLINSPSEPPILRWRPESKSTQRPIHAASGLIRSQTKDADQNIYFK